MRGRLSLSIFAKLVSFVVAIVSFILLTSGMTYYVSMRSYGSSAAVESLKSYCGDVNEVFTYVAGMLSSNPELTEQLMFMLNRTLRSVSESSASSVMIVDSSGYVI
ncbi:MAG: hypothetical protein FWE70_04100, partial [Oscillospiraceae bacterium]|nr:hypothetical protein [Oscillospiraceae bacterium]